MILKTGTTLPRLLPRGDYEDWIAAGLGVPEVRVCRLSEGEALPDAAAPRAVVITGSAAMVTDRLEWSERAAAWLLEVLARETPVLGICYGHQLLAHALGGVVGANPRGREIGTIEVDLTAAAASDPLLGGLGPRLVVSASHRQSVLQLPRGARHLGGNATDPNQAFAIGERARPRDPTRDGTARPKRARRSRTPGWDPSRCRRGALPPRAGAIPIDGARR